MVAGIFIAGAIGFIPFVLRNIIVSGYIFYPYPYLSIPVDWRVPFSYVDTTLKCMTAFSRAPYMDYRVVLKDSAWLQPWLMNLPYHRLNIVYPGIIFLVISAAYLRYVTIVKRAQLNLKIWGILCGTVGLSLLTWFFSAPDIRFIAALLWILSAGTLTIFLIALQPARNFWR